MTTSDVDRLAAALKSQTEQTWRESERADKADHMRVAIETGKVHPALAIDVNEHRQQAYQGGWNDGYAEGFAKAGDGTTTLKRELAARAIRTMGPRSPYWNCTICGASQQTPLDFRHKAECLLADTPHPPAFSHAPSKATSSWCGRSWSRTTSP